MKSPIRTRATFNTLLIPLYLPAIRKMICNKYNRLACEANMKCQPHTENSKIDAHVSCNRCGIDFHIDYTQDEFRSLGEAVFGKLRDYLDKDREESIDFFDLDFLIRELHFSQQEINFIKTLQNSRS